MASCMSRFVFKEVLGSPFLHRRYCVSYVDQAKKIQRLKANDGELHSCIETGRFVVISAKDRVPIDMQDVSKCALITSSFKEVEAVCPDVVDRLVLLNVANNGTACFACKLPEGTTVTDEIASNFQSIQVAKTFLPKDDSNAVAQGISLVNWHQSCQFCPSCGEKTVKNLSGSQRSCPSCKKNHYPSAPPVSIVLVTDNSNSKTLLVRQSRFPPGMYSCISGFIEMGETVEASVRREVAEEVGLDVEEVAYVSSQHWSLPATTLMLGCRATVAVGSNEQQLNMDQEELEDARWFTKEEAQKSVELVSQNPMAGIQTFKSKGIPWVPPPMAIAHWLIREWVNKN